MKVSSFALALLTTVSIPGLAAAQETNLNPVRAVSSPRPPIDGYDALKLLALETDLAPRDVRLVLATEMRQARYDFRFQRDMSRRFADALGPERFSDLIAGLPVSLYSPAALQEARRIAGVTDGWDSGLWNAVAIAEIP